MKQVKKLIAVILSFAIIIALIPGMNVKTQIKAAEEFVIISPTQGQLKAAGHFDIKWSEATNGTVKNYTVYLDGQKVGITTDTSYDCYTTKVEKHIAYVVAQYNDGTESKTPEQEFYITKKGLAVNNEMGAKLDPLSMNMGWYYTWGGNPFSYTTYKYAEFVPMKWGAGNEDRDLAAIAQKNYKYLLGYNEPDMGGNVGGSNIPVATAVANWNKFVGKSQYLGAPAPALSPSWDGGTWFRSFMNQIDTDTIDFIPLHCYYGNYGGVAGARTFLKEVVDATYEMYHKPIWITEFAVSGWGYSNAPARESVQEFMYEVIDGLNEREYVERYSWFSFNTTDENNGASALWTNATGVLTDLGNIYAYYGNPEGYEPETPAEPNYTITSARRTSAYNDVVTINGISCENYIQSSDVSVEASSVNGNHAAEKAIDGSLQNDSRWESAHKVDPQTFTIDLGTVRNIKQFNILWEDAGAKDYYIEVSKDGTNYIKVADIEGINNMQHRNDTIRLKEMVETRYIKITGTARATDYGYSIWELAVYGTENKKVDETTPAQTTTRPIVTRPEIPTEPPRATDSVEQTTTVDLLGEQTTSIQITTEETVSRITAVKGTLGKTIVKKATKKKADKKVKIILKKIKGAQKYQIQISKSKNFKKKLVKKTVKKVKFIIKSKKIKNKKKLYVRARAMCVVNKKKCFGKWSKAKKIKIRK
ncbi:MAG: hypothetical protein HFG29_03925 [Eubacterium sp.]|nr:hypothetical protein [Eubacterium sp.]